MILRIGSSLNCFLWYPLGIGLTDWLMEKNKLQNILFPFIVWFFCWITNKLFSLYYIDIRWRKENIFFTYINVIQLVQGKINLFFFSLFYYDYFCVFNLMILCYVIMDYSICYYILVELRGEVVYVFKSLWRKHFIQE